MVFIDICVIQSCTKPTCFGHQALLMANKQINLTLINSVNIIALPTSGNTCFQEGGIICPIQKHVNISNISLAAAKVIRTMQGAREQEKNIAQSRQVILHVCLKKVNLYNHLIMHGGFHIYLCLLQLEGLPCITRPASNTPVPSQ